MNHVMRNYWAIFESYCETKEQVLEMLSEIDQTCDVIQVSQPYSGHVTLLAKKRL